MNESETKIIRRVAFCPHCRNRAPQKLLYTHHFGENITFNTTPDETDIVSSSYYVAKCETCSDLILYHSFMDVIEPNDFCEGSIIFPRVDALHDSIPKSVAECYKEALDIKSKSPSAFAVLIRKSLEGICFDRGLKNDSLFNNLKKLAELGEIPPVLAEMTDALRILGNMGAHWNDQKVTQEQAWIIDDFFKSIVEYVYVAPSKLKEYQEKLNKIIKNNNIAE